MACTSGTYQREGRALAIANSPRGGLLRPPMSFKLFPVCRCSWIAISTDQTSACPWAVESWCWASLIVVAFADPLQVMLATLGQLDELGQIELVIISYISYLRGA